MSLFKNCRPKHVVLFGWGGLSILCFGAAATLESVTPISSIAFIIVGFAILFGIGLASTAIWD